MADPDPRDQEAQDAAWRDIVDHYGERPQLSPGDLAEPRVDEYVVPLPEPRPEPEDPPDEDQHYTPPPAPPVQLPRGVRLAAWLGVFGAPVLLVVLIVAGVTITGWIGFGLFAAFLSGFGYLVATMRKGDGDGPGDDGAVV
ncbi:MAG: hypothetical protein ACRDPH_06830 [Marmoricola sp.]